MYDIKLRYLGSVFVNAESIDTSLPNLSSLSEKLNEPGLRARQVSELSPSGQRKQRTALGSTDKDWLVILGSERFDISLLPKPLDGSNLGDFSDFCKLAGKILAELADHFELITTRITASQEGLLKEMSVEELDKAAPGLLNLPKSFSSAPPFEWTWQAVSEVNRTFGRLTKPTNTIGTFKRAKVILSNQETGEEKSFDRIGVNLEINTKPETKTQFDSAEIGAFFEAAIEWHENLSKELEAFISTTIN